MESSSLLKATVAPGEMFNQAVDSCTCSSLNTLLMNSTAGDDVMLIRRSDGVLISPVCIVLDVAALQFVGRSISVFFNF